MPGRSTIDDPLKVFRYACEVERFVRAGFSEISGLKQSTEIIKYREGNDSGSVRKSPGLSDSADIKLKRGQFIGNTSGGEDDFSAWAKNVYDSTAKNVPIQIRRTLDIIQHHNDGGEAVRWRIYEAWPTEYTPIPTLDAQKSEDSFEEISLANEGWQKRKAGTRR